MSIKILSYFDVSIECNIIENYSDTLVVLLPGIGYTCQRSLLDYSKKLAAEMGFDVLPIEYGFQIARKQVNHSDEFNIVIRECREILLKALGTEGKYKKIVFIGKSIGTLIQSSISEKLVNYKVKNIYLTPVTETIKIGIKEDSLVISGNADPLINKQAIEQLRNNENITFMEIDNADHSLNVKNDVIKSIDVLNSIIKNEKEFLKSVITL